MTDALAHHLPGAIGAVLAGFGLAMLATSIKVALSQTILLTISFSAWGAVWWYLAGLALTLGGVREWLLDVSPPSWLVTAALAILAWVPLVLIAHIAARMLTSKRGKPVNMPIGAGIGVLLGLGGIAPLLGRMGEWPADSLYLLAVVLCLSVLLGVLVRFGRGV